MTISKTGAWRIVQISRLSNSSAATLGSAGNNARDAFADNQDTKSDKRPPVLNDNNYSGPTKDFHGDDPLRPNSPAAQL